VLRPQEVEVAFFSKAKKLAIEAVENQNFVPLSGLAVSVAAVTVRIVALHPTIK
jgi:hypothetical protein